MAVSKEVYISIDVAKLRNGWQSPMKDGEFDAAPESMKHLVTRLARKHGQPTGYGLHQLITEMGHSCIVVAPSLIPRKANDRIKTNRRDATGLARLLRAGELTSVWVPDPAHEAMRNLIRSRTAVVETIRAQKQHVGAFLLRHSRIFPRHKQWGARYRRWLQHSRRIRSCCIYKSGPSWPGAPRPFWKSHCGIPDWHLAPIVEALRHCVVSTWWWRSASSSRSATFAASPAHAN